MGLFFSGQTGTSRGGVASAHDFHAPCRRKVFGCKKTVASASICNLVNNNGHQRSTTIITITYSYPVNQEIQQAADPKLETNARKKFFSRLENRGDLGPADLLSSIVTDKSETNRQAAGATNRKRIGKLGKGCLQNGTVS